MCKILSVVYFSLLIVTVVKSYDTKDEPHNEEETKIPRHHHKIKTTLKDGDIAIKITSNDGIESNKGITEESPVSKHEQYLEEVTNNETYDQTQDPALDTTTEDNTPDIEDDDSKIILGSLTRRLNNDNYDDIAPDIENPKVEGDNDSVDNGALTKSVENLIYTPNKKSLSQDIVLDLKARTGKGGDQSEEPSLQTDKDLSLESITKIGQYPLHNTNNLRSGYTPPDYFEEILKPSDAKPVDANSFNRPNSAYNNDKPQNYYPNNVRPGTIQNNFPNPLQRFSPYFFNSFNSREMFYPNPNSRESMWQGNAPKQNTVRPYFGFTHPNSQIYNPITRERCLTCQQGRDSSPERHFRRSAESDSNIFQTANGRSLEFEPSGANSYPLIPKQDDESDEVHRIQDALSQEVFGATSHEVLASQVVPKHSFQDDHELIPFSKIVMTYPPYLSRSNSIMLNRRIGLGGVQMFVG